MKKVYLVWAGLRKNQFGFLEEIFNDKNKAEKYIKLKSKIAINVIYWIQERTIQD